MCIIVFVELVVVDVVLCINEVLCWLVVVVECVLDCVLVVECYWVFDF